MEDIGDYINSAPRSEVPFTVRISSRSSSPLETHQFCSSESSSRLEVLRIPKFFTFGSTSSSNVLHVWKYFEFQSASHLEVLRVPTFYTFGSASRFEASLYIILTLGAIVAYNEIMAECRLGFDNLHNTAAPPENLSNDYVMVEYTCPCGEFTTQIPLHYLILLHHMGGLGRQISGPQTLVHLQGLADMQARAIIETYKREARDKDKDKDEDEDEDEDEEESANR